MAVLTSLIAPAHSRHWARHWARQRARPSPCTPQPDISHHHSHGLSPQPISIVGAMPLPAPPPNLSEIMKALESSQEAGGTVKVAQVMEGDGGDGGVIASEAEWGWVIGAFRSMVSCFGG